MCRKSKIENCVWILVLDPAGKFKDQGVKESAETWKKREFLKIKNR